jgi:hypothetical protein
VDGVASDKAWSCGLEFDYANEQSFYCRPLRLSEENGPQRMAVPEEAGEVRIGFLPPMSGLADREFIKEPGEVGVLIGQGQTAQVLRNMCFRVMSNSSEPGAWDELVKHIKELFGVTLLPPNYIAERSEITMEYEDENRKRLDLSASGRGLQQTLLLLAHLYANPRTVLLLDEPDAHLEILRQRQIYQLMTDVAEQQGSQVIAASHSEVVLSEAAARGIVVAFVGRPHRMNERPTQILKSLTDIGWDQYYQAEQTGWVLYLENASDLAILRAFADRLGHPAARALARPFVHYVATNLPEKARSHFYGLREAKPDLVGVALFDRIDKELQAGQPLQEMMWSRREIENYLCTKDVLLAYARQGQTDDLFAQAQAERRIQTMEESIREVSEALKTLDKGELWSPDIKATDDFLDPVFKKFFKKLGLPLVLRKTDYHVLAKLLPPESMDPEVTRKLDIISRVAGAAPGGSQD